MITKRTETVEEFVARANKIKTELEFRKAVADWVNNLTIAERTSIFHAILHVGLTRPDFEVEYIKDNVVITDIIRELGFRGLDTIYRPYKKKNKLHIIFNLFIDLLYNTTN